MNIVRKLKLSKIGIDNFSDKEKDIVNFVNSKIDNLSEFKHKDHPYSIFYMNDIGEHIMEYNITTNYLQIRYLGIWAVLVKEYLLKHDEIGTIMKYIIGCTYKFNIIGINWSLSANTRIVENLYYIHNEHYKKI